LIKKIAIAVALLAAFGGGYGLSDTIWERKYAEFRLSAEKDYSALLEKKIESDRANRSRISEIEKTHQSTLSEQKKRYEKTIASLRANFKPSGVSGCPPSGDGVPRDGGDSPELVCYTRSELYRRISETLAIGNRCDKLAINYATLLKIVEKESANDSLYD
jgi:hypothetical protein